MKLCQQGEYGGPLSNQIVCIENQPRFNRRYPIKRVSSSTEMSKPFLNTGNI